MTSAEFTILSRIIPRNVPSILPTPPDIDVPPITAAEIAVVSAPLNNSGVATLKRARLIIPANVERIATGYLQNS